MVIYAGRANPIEEGLKQTGLIRELVECLM